MATIPILKDYPVKINNTAIPYGGTMSEEYSEVETVNVSEAGTDIVQTERHGKLNFTFNFQTFSDWMEQLEEWYEDNSVKTVSIYKFSTRAYQDYSVRMRGFKKDFVEDTDKLTQTTGVWKISFKLIEM